VQYPTYLRDNSASLPPADLQRFRKQLEITTRIVVLFDSNENPDPKELMELMQEVRGDIAMVAVAARRLISPCLATVILRSQRRWSVDARNGSAARHIAPRDCTDRRATGLNGIGKGGRSSNGQLMATGYGRRETNTGAQPGARQRRLAKAASRHGRGELFCHVNMQPLFFSFDNTKLCARGAVRAWQEAVDKAESRPSLQTCF
jgi:hypothetical protein